MKKFGVVQSQPKEAARSVKCSVCGQKRLKTDDRTYPCPKCGNKGE